MKASTEISLHEMQDYSDFPFQVYLKLIEYYESETILDWDLNLDCESLLQHHYVCLNSPLNGYINWQMYLHPKTNKSTDIEDLSLTVVLQLCLYKGNCYFKQIAKQLIKQNYRVNQIFQSFNTRILPVTTILITEQAQVNFPKRFNSDSDELTEFFTKHFDKILEALNQIYDIRYY